MDPSSSSHLPLAHLGFDLRSSERGVVDDLGEDELGDHQLEQARPCLLGYVVRPICAGFGIGYKKFSCHVELKHPCTMKFALHVVRSKMPKATVSAKPFRPRKAQLRHLLLRAVNHNTSLHDCRPTYSGTVTGEKAAKSCSLMRTPSSNLAQGKGRLRGTIHLLRKIVPGPAGSRTRWAQRSAPLAVDR